MVAVMGIDQLAHEMALAMQSVEPITDMTLIAKLAYQYADAEEAYSQVQTPDVINTEFSFIKEQLERFMKSFRPTKSVKDRYVKAVQQL